MSKLHEHPLSSASKDDRQASTRRPYRKPRIVHHEALEAVAADCSVAGGKGDPTCIVGFS